MTRRVLRNWVLRLAAGGVVYACLVGPAPGNVGGCGATNPIADAPRHCVDKQWWECQRDLTAGRTNMEEFDACIAPIGRACMGAAWPAGCLPTQSQSNACIVLVSRSDLVSFTTEDLHIAFPDCNLCP